MCEIALQDDLNYLNNSTSLNTFREDSPDTDLQSSPSSPSSQSSSDSSAIKKWEISERKSRIMNKIEAVIKDLEEADDEQYIRACWEDLGYFQE